MNPRLTISAAIAVIAASLSLNAVVSGNGWLFAGIGAVVCVALAGSLTRLSGIRAAAGATFLVLIAVMPLLTAHSWYPRIGGLLIVAVIAASGFAGRLPRLVATLATYLAILLIYLNLAFEPGKSFALVIPTQRSLTALSRLPSAAVSQFHYLPPIGDIAPVSFFAAAGIGLIAICVDILAVWLRRPAIAGLPLLALFSVPVASNVKGFGIGEWLTFAAGLAGFLLLLSSDGRQRLRMWGRLVAFRYVQPTDEAGPGPDIREIAASGRRVGLAAVCLAIVVPAVLPTMHVHDIFAGPATGTGSGTGGSTPTGPLAPLVQVQADLNETTAQKVLTYTTNSPASETSEQYLQVYALNYDAKKNQWGYGSLTGPGAKSVAATGKLPLPIPGLTSAVRLTRVTTNVAVAASMGGEATLAMPYAPVSMKVQSAGRFTETPSLTVFSGNESMSGLVYSVTSSVPDPTVAQLETQSAVPPAIMKDYGSYDGPYASRLRTIAESITAGVSSDPFQQAEALQDYFLSKFGYSLKPGLPQSSRWLLDFLTSDRRGSCQQFSWAFAVLARLLGIPTRIAIGYTAGTEGSHGKWTVTTRDAHAWPEIYITNVGWVRFEPTPSGSTGQGTAVVPAYATGIPAGSQYQLPPHSGTPGSSNPGPASTGSNPEKHITTGSSCTGGHLHIALPSSICAGAAAAGRIGAPRKPGFPWPVLIPIVLILLLACPGLGRLAIRRRRWRSASGNSQLADAAWHELIDDLDDYGLPSQPSESPRALARRIAGEADLDDAGRQALTRIRTAEERARYAASARPGDSLRADVQTVRRAIAADSTRSQRLRAVLLPASTLADIRSGLQRVGDLFGWLDTSLPAMQRQVRRSVLGRSEQGAG